MPVSDDDLLDAMREGAREELRFFSNKGRTKRECWIVSQFLELRSIDFGKDELECPPQSSKIDVRFRTANFQVKEIVSPGSKRSDEVKNRFNRLNAAKTPAEAIDRLSAYDVPPTSSIYSLVLEQASGLVTQYADYLHELDLLFYVTRTRASPVRRDEICVDQLAPLGWRSISCVAGDQATVLFAQDNAPEFLRSKDNR